MNPQSFYTINEFASLVKIHPHTVRDRYRRGLIRGVRIGRAIRIHSSEIERLIASASAPTATESSAT
jgi:excisionase family DNA binding protein